jgi:hypothetical protein
MSDRLRILTLCDSPRQTGEMLALHEHLRDVDLFVLALDENICNKLKESGIPARVLSSRVRRGHSFFQYRLQQLTKLFAKLNWRHGHLVSEFLLGISHFLSSVGDRGNVATVLRDFSPHGIFLESDRSLGLSSLILVENARATNPSPVFFSMSALMDLEGTLFNRHRKPSTWPESFPDWVNDFWQKKHPDNWHAYPGTQGRYFFSLSEWIHLKMLDALPPKPWTIGTWPEGRVLVPSQMQEEMLVMLGTSREVIVRLGSPELDKLYHHYVRSQVSPSLPKTEKVRVVIAVPQLWEHGICSYEDHWAQVKALSRLQDEETLDIYFSLHPRMDRATYVSILGENRVLSIPLLQAIGEADVFLSTYSSTIPWAFVCKKPVVIVDLTNINVKTFEIFDGIIAVRSATELVSSIHLAKSQGVYPKTVQMAGGDVFDGKYGQRLWQVIQQGLNK